jgi:selenocysteine lyase/cysteine desulfurase
LRQLATSFDRLRTNGEFALSFKQLFSRALTAAPDRLHFAAHSHHLWPDASFAGQVEGWDDAAALADHKWNKVMGPMWSEAQQHVARELTLPDPATISFSSNTHDFLVRIVSAMPMQPVHVLASDGEFHSFRRQIARWVKSGAVVLETVPAEALVTRAEAGGFDLLFTSHVLFNSGTVMALETDLSAFADRVFYLSGGYKYAMAGEGVCFLHAPPGFAPRPVITGWYAAFNELHLPPGEVGYAPDGRRFLGSTFDPSGLYRFNAVQRMLQSEGLTTAKISAHVADLHKQFCDAAPLPHLSLLNPLDDKPHARFLAYKGAEAPAVHAMLESKNIVTDLRGDVLRIGFGLYHDADDVRRLIAILT